MAKRDKSGSTTMQDQEQERKDTLQKYVSDMMAVEEHIGSAVKRQVKDENLAKHSPQASQLINNIANTTERHEQELKRHLEAIGGDAAKGIKEVATAALGTLAGLYDKVRTETISKMFRDDYTALNLATIGYTMLHTTGLALNDQATAALALRHLKAYTSIVMQINQSIPSVVVADLRDNGAMVNESVIQQAVSNTQEVWQPSSSQNGGSSNGGNGNALIVTSKPRTTTSKRTSIESAAASNKPSASKTKRSGTTASSKPLAATSAHTASETNTTPAKRSAGTSKAKGNTPATKR